MKDLILRDFRLQVNTGARRRSLPAKPKAKVIKRTLSGDVVVQVDLIDNTSKFTPDDWFVGFSIFFF
jgi:hypothetical protein